MTDGGCIVEEEVTYWSGGEQLHGALFRPSATTSAAPAIVFCPGYTGTRFAEFYRPYVAALVDAGYAVLLSDYRGWGSSGGQRGAIYPLWQVADIRAGITYLESREDIDDTRVGLFGVSFGGGIAAYVGGVDDRVQALVSVSGIASGADWLRSMRREYEWQDFLDRLAAERRRMVGGEPATKVHPNQEIMIETPERRQTTVKGRVDQAMVPQETPLDCAQAILEFRPLDVVSRAKASLWVYVERDSIVPPEHSLALYEAATSDATLLRLPGRGHYSAYVEHFEAISEASLELYDLHLRGAGQG